MFQLDYSKPCLSSVMICPWLSTFNDNELRVRHRITSSYISKSHSIFALDRYSLSFDVMLDYKCITLLELLLIIPLAHR